MKVLALPILFIGIIHLSQTKSTGSLGVANGTVEEPYSSPWQARLYLAQGGVQWPCGGTLISPNYVLTAARCFSYQRNFRTNGIAIYLGVWDIQHTEIEDSKVYIETSTRNVVYHEGYNITTQENDIALIKLPKPVSLNKQIQAAKLASVADVSVGQVGHISGWQYPYREWDPRHQYIHGGDVTVVENSVCQKTYPEYVINENIVCTAGSVAVCYGDEGVALPIGDKIVGMAVGALEVEYPSEQCPIIPNTWLYIPKYLNWIKANSDYQD